MKGEANFSYDECNRHQGYGGEKRINDPPKNGAQIVIAAIVDQGLANVVGVFGGKLRSRFSGSVRISVGYRQKKFSVGRNFGPHWVRRQRHSVRVCSLL